MKVIIVTGSVGTGKTTLSKMLAKELDFHYVDVNKIIKKYKLSEGYDKKRKTKMVDVKKLNKALIKEISCYNKKISNINKSMKNNNKIRLIKNKKNYNKKSEKIKNGIIIDSHLSHYLPKKYVDLCIVTKCKLKELERRLKKKKYSKEKIRENLDAEIFDICLNEAIENNHRVFVINTTKGINITPFAKKLVI